MVRASAALRAAACTWRYIHKERITPAAASSSRWRPCCSSSSESLAQVRFAAAASRLQQAKPAAAADAERGELSPSVTCLVEGILQRPAEVVRRMVHLLLPRLSLAISARAAQMEADLSALGLTSADLSIGDGADRDEEQAPGLAALPEDAAWLIAELAYRHGVRRPHLQLILLRCLAEAARESGPMHSILLWRMLLKVRTQIRIPAVNS